MAAEQARDRDTAAAVVAGRRPDGTVGGGVEPPRDEARHQAAVRGQHLVGLDQRKAVAERQHDLCLDSRQLGRQDDVLGDLDEVRPVGAVVPVHPEQVQRVRVVRPDALERITHHGRNQRGMGELRERRQRDARLPEVVRGSLECLGIGLLASQAESVCDHSASTLVVLTQRYEAQHLGSSGFLPKLDRGFPCSAASLRLPCCRHACRRQSLLYRPDRRRLRRDGGELLSAVGLLVRGGTAATPGGCPLGDLGADGGFRARRPGARLRCEHGATALAPPLNAFVGRQLRGRVVRTIVRGSTVCLGGDMVASPGGRFVRPRLGRTMEARS